MSYNVSAEFTSHIFALFAHNIFSVQGGVEHAYPPRLSLPHWRNLYEYSSPSMYLLNFLGCLKYFGYFPYFSRPYYSGFLYLVRVCWAACMTAAVGKL
jgi:hypothetical protein